jgi:hypothetical protein
MDHNLQVLLAIGISAALCLVTWTWARYCRFSRERQLTARTRGVKAAAGLRSSASSAFRFAVARSESPAPMPA